MRSTKLQTARLFTLIEMMVVIAIIAVIAALLVPAVTKARDKVRTTQCSSNIRQVMIATLMYLEGNDDVFPPQYWAYDALLYCPNRVETVTQYGNYQCYVEPYAESMEVFMCPSSSQAEPKARFAYDYAGNTLMDGQPAGLFNNRRVNGIKQSTSDWAYTADTNYEWIQMVAPWRIEARHNRQVNVGFLDGHAATLSALEVGTGPRCFGWTSWFGGVITVP